MSKTRFAKRVGLFMTVALLVLVALVVVFTRGGSWFQPSYELRLRSETVSGLKKSSVVLMAGVPIGRVGNAELLPGGKHVIIRLKIYDRYKIHGDARFVIESIGFLGDQFVAVYPRENARPILESGAEVSVEPSFSFQETARSATELVDEVKKIVKTLNELVVRVDQKVLSERNLTNVNVTLNNLRVASDKVTTMVDGMSTLVQTNSPSISVSVSNLVQFSQRLNGVAGDLSQLLATNRLEFAEAINSLDNAAKVLERVAHSVEEGRGLVGALINDEDLKAKISNVAENLQNVSSNINRFGLLYKPRQSRQAQNPPYPGKSSIK